MTLQRNIFFASFSSGMLAVLLTSFSAFAEKVPVTVSREFCHQLLTEAVSSADVAYTPGVDVHGVSVAPADLGGGFQIKVPDKVTLPIEVDVRRYLKAPAEQTAAKQVQLDQLRTNLSKESSSLQKSQETVATQLTTLATGNETLSTQITEDPTDAEISKGIEQALDLVTKVADTLKGQPETIKTSTTLLEKSAQTLEQVVSEFDYSPNVIQRNNAFQQDTLKGAGEVSNNLGQGQSDLTSLSQQLSTLSASLQTVTENLDEETLTTLTEKLATAETSLTAAQESFSSGNFIAKTLDSLTQTGKTLAELGVSNQKTTFVEKASVGSVEVHMDGRAYFNGQPLFNEEQAALKEACRRYLDSNP